MVFGLRFFGMVFGNAVCAFRALRSEKPTRTALKYARQKVMSVVRLQVDLSSATPTIFTKCHKWNGSQQTTKEIISTAIRIVTFFRALARVSHLTSDFTNGYTDIV